MTAILVVLTVLFFLALDLARLAYNRRRAAAGPRPAAAFSDLRYPRGLFLDESHAWASLTDVGEIRVGADELVGQALGRVDTVDLPQVGTVVRKGQPLAQLHTGRQTLAVPSPVSGTVVAVNPMVEYIPEAMRQDPYGAAWFARIWPAEHTEALSGLKVGDRAAAWLRSETQRLVDFLSRRAAGDRLGAVLADGAHPAIGALAALSGEHLREFGKEFLGQGGH